MVQPVPVAPSASMPGDDLDEVASCLAGAERPVIVAGSGVHYAGEGDALAKFSETFSVPLGVLALDRDSIKRPHPSFVGLVGALTENRDYYQTSTASSSPASTLTIASAFLVRTRSATTPVSCESFRVGNLSPRSTKNATEAPYGLASRGSAALDGLSTIHRTKGR